MYWETYDGDHEIRELEGSKQGSINGMDISSDGSHFVTGGDDKEIRVRQTFTAFLLVPVTEPFTFVFKSATDILIVVTFLCVVNVLYKSGN